MPACFFPFLVTYLFELECNLTALCKWQSSSVSFKGLILVEKNGFKIKTTHNCPIMSLMPASNIINDTCTCTWAVVELNHRSNSWISHSIKPYNHFIWKFNIWSNYVQGYLHFRSDYLTKTHKIERKQFATWILGKLIGNSSIALQFLLPIGLV